MYVKVMAAVIACILMSGETHSTSATIPATENQSWFKKRKKKPEQEEKTKSDYEKLVEGSKITKGMFAVHQKKNDYYFEIPTSLLGRDLLILKSATKLFSVLLASKRPLITELADKLRLKYPLLPTISPCPTMRLEAIRSIIPISCRRYPKSV